MPKSYSGDLRERVIEAVETGASRREAAEHFGVSVSSAVKWLQRWHESRSAAPKPRGGSISALEEVAAKVLALIAEQPDLTLVETVAELRRRRIRTSRSSLWRFLDRHDITLKKSLQAAERQRAELARARRRWMREQGMLDPARLVFIDETAVSTNMVRLNGRAPRGVRLIGSVPLGTWETITFVAALRVRIRRLRSSATVSTKKSLQAAERQRADRPGTALGVMNRGRNLCSADDIFRLLVQEPRFSVAHC
jgi:transposase